MESDEKEQNDLLQKEEKEACTENSGEEEKEAAETEKSPLELLKEEKEKWRDLALRSQAELDNFRKRMAREKTESIRFGNMILFESLLPILDHFEFGLEAARKESSESSIYKGMAMVYQQIQDFLKNQGVEEIETTDALFDPKLHEAVAEEVHPEIEPGKIIRQIRRGYKMHDRLLRASNVVVSKEDAAARETKEEGEK